MTTARINWPTTILLILGTSLILFPVYLTVMIAVKSPEQIAQSVLAIPTNFHFENFVRAIKLTNFFNAFKNSAIITGFAVIFTVLSNSMVAYAIARNMDNKFFRFLYFYFVSAMFVPFPIIMLPLVKETSSLGMDNQWGLILLYIVYGLAFNVFVYVGYIKSVPKELEEAAIVDGAGIWTVFWKIIFPLLKPMNATVGILTCLWVWNDFLLPLVIIGSDKSQATLPLVQYIFQSKFNTAYNLAFASYLLALLPMIVVYLFAQKWIIGNLARGAVK